MADLKVKQENEAKGKKGSGSFGKLNAATRRAIYSFGILAGLFLLFSVLQVDKFLASLRPSGSPYPPKSAAADRYIHHYRVRTNLLSGLRGK